MSWGDQRNLGGAGGPIAWSPSAYYKAGNIAVSLADYQYYARKVDGSSPTDPANDTTNWFPVGGRPIKSIQRGLISTNGTISATVTQVVIAKTELRFLGAMNSSVWINAYVYLQNNTTVTSISQPGYAGTLSWELTEYY